VSFLLALVGPTASGKTRMGVEVALELGPPVEIVSCDSMGVYRGLDIAADKPGAAERRGVPHHLFDLVDASEPFTAVEYRERARAVIADIHGRGSVPLLVGGSGLYFRAVVDDLEFAPSDPDVRARLEAEDPAALYRRLAEADPERAGELDPRNTRRVVRAVEILELTGRPPSELRESWNRREGPYGLCAAGLTWSREELFARAGDRVRREMEAGLVDEVARARQQGISRTARQALGVKEVLEYLEGNVSLEEAEALNVRNTKNFIRRQISWFGADPRVEWFDASELGWDGVRRAILARFHAALSLGA
jgi:tRNA dimethylallyltransferase